MKKTGKLTLLLVTVLSLTLMMGLSASAAAKRKLVKTLKEYDINGNLSRTTSYKYNAKGDTTSEIYKEYSKGKVCLTQKTTMKRSYYKGTGRVKKVTYKRSLSGRKSKFRYSYFYTYTRRGALKTSVYQDSGGDYVKASFKSSGSRIKSCTTRDKKGRKIVSVKFDRYGNITSVTDHESKDKVKYKYTYEKGIIRKKVITVWGTSEIYTYNSYGDQIQWESGNDRIISENQYKDGYLKEIIRYSYNNELKKYEKYTSDTYTWTGKTYKIKKPGNAEVITELLEPYRSGII